MTVITYDELAAGLEDAWLMAGLHEHLLAESIVPDAFERVYRVELFPEHPQPIPENAPPPWVELNFTWSATHQLHTERRDVAPDPLEISWTYTVDVRAHGDRTDVDLSRAFNGAVRAALRRAAPDIIAPSEYIAIEVRRGYRTNGDKPALAYVQLVGTNVTDLSDLWSERDPNTLREALRDELLIVSAVLHTLSETFTPSAMGGYRPVDTA